MATPKKLEYTAILGFILQLASMIVCVVLAGQSKSRAVAAEAWHLGAGLLVWAVVLIHGRQRRLAREEREEYEQLKKTRLSEEIFEEGELDRMRASSGLLFFEKFLVPLFSLLLSGVLFYVAYRNGWGLWELGPAGVQKPAIVAVGMIFVAFFGFLVGKYAAGLAQGTSFRLLRAAGGFLLGNVIANVLLAIAMVLYYFELTWAETVVAYFIPALVALVGVEMILNLILDIYRPRVAGQETRPPYDSRILGLFAEPGGVLKTVAATLDYQFGFKVSETWFYRFMERAIVPLVLIQILSLWLLSSIVVVGQEEIAFMETFGQPHVTQEDAEVGLKASVYGPGFHLKWPWPIGIARYVPANLIQTVELGRIYDKADWTAEDSGLRIAEDDKMILWSEQHVDPKLGREASFLVPSIKDVEFSAARAWQGSVATEAATGPVEEPVQTEPDAGGSEEDALPEEETKTPPVNLARLLAHVHFRVRRNADGTLDEGAAYAYCYEQSDLREHVKLLSYRALCRMSASQDFIEWVSRGRGEATQRLWAMIEEGVREAGLGVDIVFVGIPAVHPPPETAQAFESVVASLEVRDARELRGKETATESVAQAEAIAEETVNAAIGESARRRATAVADRYRFEKVVEAYGNETLRQVYMFRRFFEAMELALKGQDVVVLPEGSQQIQIIDLAEGLPSALLDISASEE
jgi:regulator of protease activity HflC (stomatin/prohibitin superfamily)